MGSKFKQRDLSFTAIKNFVLRRKATEAEENAELKEQNGVLRPDLAVSSNPGSNIHLLMSHPYKINHM
jgi:hypothetical protein